jgi:hypothetical protein
MGAMFNQVDNLKRFGQKEIVASPGFYLAAKHLRKHSPIYLLTLMDKEKIEKVRKTISQTEVVFNNQKDNPEKQSFYLNSDNCRRIDDLQNILPNEAKKFIKYRKEKSERARG